METITTSRRAEVNPMKVFACETFTIRLCLDEALEGLLASEFEGKENKDKTQRRKTLSNHHPEQTHPVTNKNQ